MNSESVMLARAGSDVTTLISDYACAFVADEFNMGIGGELTSKHAGGYISWPAFDELLVMIAKAVSQAAAKEDEAFGKHYYGTNTDFSNGDGQHWVAVVFEILPGDHGAVRDSSAQSGIAQEHGARAPPTGPHVSAQSRSRSRTRTVHAARNARAASLP